MLRHSTNQHQQGSLLAPPQHTWASGPEVNRLLVLEILYKKYIDNWYQSKFPSQYTASMSASLPDVFRFNTSRDICNQYA